MSQSASRTSRQLDRALRGRYRRIMRFASGVMVRAWWWELFLPRIGFGALSARTRTKRWQRIAERYYPLAVSLGGLMIKIGQFMSTRLDVLPPEVTRTLEELQDEVPAVPFAEIVAEAEAELGVPLEHAFATFEQQPLAAASLGQVHRVTLTPEDASISGFTNAVVKVQRPHIDRIIDVDLAALRRVARGLSRVRAVASRVNMPALVEEFGAVSLQEVDYLHEALNAERFSANFAERRGVEAPAVVWERTSRRVLTLQDVGAIKLADVDALRAAGIDPVAVAEAFGTAMFEQVLVDGFFHADPHPGNVFVTPTPEADDPWHLTFIDFGMMGTVSGELRTQLRQLLVAVATQNARDLVTIMVEAGVLLPGADMAQLERMISVMFGRFGGMSNAEMRELDPRQFIDFGREFGELVRTLPVQLPEQFLLLIRATSITSGVCTALDPAFNVWAAMQPHALQLMQAEQASIVRDLGRSLFDNLRALSVIPRRADDLITHLEAGRLTVDTSRLERRVSRIERIGSRALAAFVFTGVLIGGVLVRAEDLVLSNVLLIASIVPLAGTVVGRRPR